MMTDPDLQLDRALARIHEPLVTLIAPDATLAESLPARWRIQHLPHPGSLPNSVPGDLVLIDVQSANRPQLIEDCRTLTTAPVIVVTGDAGDVARHLKRGADACVSPRTNAQEWQARFEALIREVNRPASAIPAHEFEGSDLHVSLAKQQVFRSDVPVDLTPREFGVLCTLLRAAPASVSSERIAEALWDSSTRAARARVRVYVARLRRKLEIIATRPRVIVTDGSAYRATLTRTGVIQRRTCVLLIGHDELTAERRHRDLATSGIETVTAEAGVPLLPCSFDAILTPVDPVAIARARLAFGQFTPPLIATTEDGDPAPVIASLEAGAVDVIPYPGRPGDLAARVEAAVRRARTPGTVGTATLRTGALEIDLNQQRVESHGREVQLSPTEYRLLATLARHVDHVMSHQELLTRAWGPEYQEETHYIRVYVRSLRAKLEDDPSEPRYVVSEWGRGYRLAALPVESHRDAREPALMA